MSVAVTVQQARKRATRRPTEAEAQHRLGLALYEQGRAASAIPYLERAVRLDRADWCFHHNLGLAYQSVGRFEDALLAFEAAVERNLDHYEVWHNLGTAYMATQQLDKAETALRQSLHLNPSYPLSPFNLGCVHLIWGEVRQAARWFARALDRRPDFEKAHANLIFCRDLLPETTPGTALAERKAYQTRHCAPLKQAWLPYDLMRDPERRLRVGYIGGDFRDHSAMYSFGPIIAGHDPERVEVAIYADLRESDTYTSTLKQRADVWRDILGWSEERIAATIRADRVDVLVELSGYTNRHHLLAVARRPTPVQVTGWGYLTGLGLDAVDAILADDIVLPPEHEHQYVERPVRLPHAIGFSPPPFDVPITPRPPDGPVVFGYLGRIAKLSDATLDLWAEVLRAVPGSRLLLKDRGFSEARPVERVRRAFAARRIDPARLDIRGTTERREHLATYNEIDVALDPIPQGGGMTTLEATWMGTLSVTLLGDRIPGRVSSSHLDRLGIGVPVATDVHEYVEIAQDMAARREKGAWLRRCLLDSAICDMGAQTQAVEAGYRDLWRAWCASGSPEVVPSNLPLVGR